MRNLPQNMSYLKWKLPTQFQRLSYDFKGALQVSEMIL
jgi:hypothetical protein